MKTKPPLKNMAASVQDRLRLRHQKTKEDYQLLMNRYVMERLLYRISKSTHRDRFVLKGAMLFLVWHGSPHRITRDMDLLGFGASSIEALERIFRELCEVAVEDDGVVFDGATVKGEQIRAQEAYLGVRILLRASIARSVVALQVDVGFGDDITVEPVEMEIPGLLDMPTAHVRGYRRETAIAEKYEALVGFGLLNSRMKDYFDFWFLGQHFEFAGDALSESIRATFARRSKVLPPQLPVGLTDAFSSDAGRQIVWKAFWKKSVKTESMPALVEVVAFAAKFLGPPALAAATGEQFTKNWPAGGGWQS